MSERTEVDELIDRHREELLFTTGRWSSRLNEAGATWDDLNEREKEAGFKGLDYGSGEDRVGGYLVARFAKLLQPDGAIIYTAGMYYSWFPTTGEVEDDLPVIYKKYQEKSIELNVINSASHT